MPRVGILGVVSGTFAMGEACQEDDVFLILSLLTAEKGSLMTGPSAIASQHNQGTLPALESQLRNNRSAGCVSANRGAASAVRGMLE